MSDAAGEIGKLRRELREANIRIKELKRRRRLEGAREAEERYRLIVETTNEGILVTDSERKITFANPRMADMVGYPMEEMVGRVMGEFLFADQEQRAGETRKELAAGLRVEKEFTFRRKDGSALPVISSATPVFDAQDRYNGAISMITDLTDRKKTEEEIQSLARFPAENPFPVLRLSREGSVLYANAAGKALTRLWNIPDGGRVPDRLAELIAEASTTGLQKTVELECGERVYSFALVPPQGVEYVNMYGADVTGRKRAEEALKKAHDDLEVKVRERTAELQRVNQTLMMVSGCNQALVRASDEMELVGEICRIIHDLGGYRMAWVGYAENDAARSVRPVASVGFEDGYLDQAKITWADEERGRGPTGSCIRLREVRFCKNFLTDPELAPWREQALKRGFLSSIALPLMSETQVLGALSIYSDRPEAFGGEQAALLAELSDDLAFGIMTLRARAELARALRLAEERTAQLRALAVELGHAEQRERHRLAKVLHDHLQQILVGVKFSLSALQEEAQTESTAKALQRVTEMQDEAIQVAHSLTADLSPPALHDHGLLAGLEWLGRDMKRKHGLNVRIQANEDVEPASVDVRVFLYEAVRELLFNVVKHAGVDSARVGLARLEDGRIQVTVVDKGVGFEPGTEDMSRFGLFSIRERLYYLGGDMEVESAPGCGTRFSLLIPAGFTPSQPEAPTPASGAFEPGEARSAGPVPGAHPGRGRKIRVILADDHQIMRQGLALLLQGLPDIEVVGEAADGEEAVALARRLHPDIVLMDVSMPGVNGFEATRRILCEFPQVRVIGLSMHDEADMAAEMRKAGAVGYFTKGGPAKNLISAVRSCVNAEEPKEPME
jgi:PAS domain S-box-containing protein